MSFLCAACGGPADLGALLRVVPLNGEHDWYVHRASVGPSCFHAVPAARVAMIAVDQLAADAWDAAAGGPPKTDLQRTPETKAIARELAVNAAEATRFAGEERGADG